MLSPTAVTVSKHIIDMFNVKNTVLVSLRQKATSSSIFGWQSYKHIACIRGMRQLMSIVALCARCPMAQQLDQLTEMEIWWFLHEVKAKKKWLKISSGLIKSPLYLCYQSSVGLVDSTLASGVLPSANTAVNKKVSAWLQQSLEPDTCAQGKDTILTKL